MRARQTALAGPASPRVWRVDLEACPTQRHRLDPAEAGQAVVPLREGFRRRESLPLRPAGFGG